MPTPSLAGSITAARLPQPAITILNTAVPPQAALHPSTQEHPNTSTPEHLNTPTPEHLNTPTPEHPNTPTPEHPNTPTPEHPITISAADPRLNFIGRFNFADPAAPTFDWPGTAVELSFTGNSLTVLLEDSGNW
jgi:hypothetical protein